MRSSEKKVLSSLAKGGEPARPDFFYGSGEAAGLPPAPPKMPDFMFGSIARSDGISYML